MSEVRRKGIALKDQAALLLYLADALRAGVPETPFGVALGSFLRRSQVDPERLSRAIARLQHLCFDDDGEPSSRPFASDLASGHSSDQAGLEAVLRRWRDETVHRPIEGASTSTPADGTEHFSERRPSSIRGKYAYIGFGSADHAAEKRREAELEDRI